MKQKIVGHYSLGNESVELVIREGTGGEFYCCPELGKTARLKIGVEQESWEDVLKVLLHEALEYLLTRNCCRYEATGDLSDDHSAYKFWFDHVQLSHMCACLGMFLARVLPDLARAYKAFRKP